MQVTVLMPVYNAERFLDDSIGSLLSQTIKDWKLICIDDGSTDSSLQILRKYEADNERIKVLVQENAGPAVARAKAIEFVDTEYVSILDSDDAYAPDYVELMLKRAEETNADSIVPDAEFGYGNTKKIPNLFKSNHLNGQTLIKDGKQAFAMTIPWKLHGWQMIRTSLAKQYYTVANASYSKFNSDEYITRLLYLKSKKVALCDAEYLYRIGEGSITRSPSLKKLDYLITIDKLIELIKEEKIPTNVLLNLYNDYYATLKSMATLVLQLPINEQKEGKRRIMIAYNESYRKNMTLQLIMQAPFRTKIKFTLSLISQKFIL